MGLSRGQKRKDATSEDGGSTTKRTKKAVADIAEEPEEDEPQDDVKAYVEADVDEAAV
jgi:hypothetical protein